MAILPDTTDSGSDSGGEVIEVDGLLWKPKPGTTAAGEEFRRARSLILEVHRDASWNPWVEEDRAQEYERATAVFEQWTRAEPDFLPLTSEELDAQMAAWDAEFQAHQAERDRQRAARVALYDAGREQARLALLEQQVILRHYTEELDGLRERRQFPEMPEQRRREQIAELERSVAAARSEVVRLQEAVGDVEAVVDERGWLPRERRELALTLFSADRCAEVRALRNRVKEQQATLKATKGRAERAPIRDALNRDTPRLEFLMAIPPLKAADMCSECVSPAGWHGYVTTGANLDAGPCPAWPQWAQRIRKVWQMLAAAAKDKPAEPPPPKPEPLTVIASGLPIAEVVRQLTDLQAKYPAARVRRGNRSRWRSGPDSAFLRQTRARRAAPPSRLWRCATSQRAPLEAWRCRATVVGLR